MEWKSGSQHTPSYTQLRHFLQQVSKGLSGAGPLHRYPVPLMDARPHCSPAGPADSGYNLAGRDTFRRPGTRGTGGGDAPGLNAVIRAVTISAL